MATLVCSPNKLHLEPKPNRLSLKKAKLHHSESTAFFPLKSERIQDKVYQDNDLQSGSDVNQVEKYLGSLGLPNCGNTCYLNSIIQVLRFTPNFMQKVHTALSSCKQLQKDFPDAKEEHGLFFYKLHLLFMTMKKQEIFMKRKIGIDVSEFLLKNLEEFLSSLRSISSSFEEGEQHDAHELLLTILSLYKAFCNIVKENISLYLENSQSSCNLEIFGEESSNVYFDNDKKIKPGVKRKRKFQRNVKKAPIFCYTEETSDLGFHGTMRHIIKCLECEKKSIKSETFTNLEICIADDCIIEGTINLSECLEQKTVLNGDNKYFCEDCYQKNEALSCYDIIDPPSILLLHLSWLRQSSNITDVEKDTTKVLIPLFLKTSENPNIFCCQSDEMYALYAVVLHIGCTTEVGHYVAFIKNASKTPQMMKRINAYQSYYAKDCCATEEILNYKLFTSDVNNWLLFDDDEVTPIYVDESFEIFPYFEYLGITASPCLIFYFKM